MVHLYPLLVAVLGGMVLLILIERKRLHSFAREKLHRREIEAFVVLLIFAIGVLPFLPNHTIDPWHLFNPRLLGLLMVVIAGLQFGGYVVIRMFGHQIGMSLLGFLGGVISSTALYLLLPKYYKDHPRLFYAIIAAAAFSVVATLFEYAVILFAAAPDLLMTQAIPLVTMLSIGSLIGVGFMLLQNVDHDQIAPVRNPLDVKSILRLTIFIGSILILVTIAKQVFGTKGVLLVSFLGGLFELHGLTLATASLYVTGKLPFLDANIALASAVLASFISKFFILWSIAHNRFVLWVSVMLLCMLIPGAVLFLFF